MNIDQKLDKALANIEVNKVKTELVELSWHEILTLKRLLTLDNSNTSLLRENLKESNRLRKILDDY